MKKIIETVVISGLDALIAGIILAATAVWIVVAFIGKAFDVMFRDLQSFDKDLTPKQRDRLLQLWTKTLSDKDGELSYDMRRTVKVCLRTDCENSGALCLVSFGINEGDDMKGIRREMLNFLTARGLTRDGVRIHIHEKEMIACIDLLDGEKQLSGTVINHRINIVLDMIHRFYGCDNWNDYLAGEIKEDIQVA